MTSSHAFWFLKACRLHTASPFTEAVEEDETAVIVGGGKTVVLPGRLWQTLCPYSRGKNYPSTNVSSLFCFEVQSREYSGLLLWALHLPWNASSCMCFSD